MRKRLKLKGELKERGSLRNAIQQANANAGPDTISFAIPKADPHYDSDIEVWFIQPQSSLPVISDNGLVIDASTQTQISVNPHGPEIVIDGSNLSGEASGLTSVANGTEIYCLTINRFPRAGIEMNGVGGGRIAGCYLGTDFGGMGAAGNTNGVYLLGKTGGVEIVPCDTLPNLISGNTNSGIFISDSSDFNIVVGNIIGLSRDGTFAIGNLLQGIVIQDGCKSNEILENLIGGNDNGVSIYGSNDNVVAHNRIGTDETWRLEAGNEKDGIYLASGASGNRVVENIIGYNGDHGVYVHGSQAIGNSLTRNGISRNGGAGIRNGSGGNSELTPPVIVSASPTDITGTAGPGQIIEVFSDEEDEGRIFLGTVTADASGNFALSFQEPVPLPHVTATCTDAEGNTSQFCPPFNVTSVAEGPESQIPHEFSLSQNYPNPFNPETVIRYSLPREAFVEIQIVNLAGEIVATLVDKSQEPGVHSVNWHGTDSHGNLVASGVYLYRFKTDRFVDVKKMLFIKLGKLDRN